jgi:transposase
LCDALGATADVPSLYRRLLAMTLAELDLMESQMQQLDEELAALLRVHQAAVQRLAAVPGFGVDSAQQIIAEVGPTATTFPTAKAPGVLGRRLSRTRGERRHQPQSPRPERKPPNAPTAESGHARRGED